MVIERLILVMVDPRIICVFLVVCPIVVALLTPLKRSYKNLFYLLASLVPILNILLLLSQGYFTHYYTVSKAFVFSIDRFSYLFVVILNVCWLLTIWYSHSYLRHQFETKADTFHQYLAAAVSFASGGGLAGNFFTLAFFYTISIPVIFPLITIRKDEQSKKAGRIYLLSTLVPTLLIVVPTILICFPLFEPFNSFSIKTLGYSERKASILLALLIVGFSKNCVAPFHLWLPISAIAPAPVTALVHSVAAVQTASIALLKIATLVYGNALLSRLNDHFFQTGWLTYLCGGTAIYTAYRAWKTPNLKQRFSFSTVGQLSYILTAILVGTKQTMLGAALHIVTHSFAKLNLMFCAGIFKSVFGTVEASEVARRIPSKRWLGLVTSVSGLSIMGFPFLAGYYSKDLMLIEEVHRHHYAGAAFLVFGSFINLVYMFPLVRATFFGRPEKASAVKPVPKMMVLSLVACTTLIISFSQYVFFIMRILNAQ